MKPSENDPKRNLTPDIRELLLFFTLICTEQGSENSSRSCSAFLFGLLRDRIWGCLCGWEFTPSKGLQRREHYNINININFAQILSDCVSIRKNLRSSVKINGFKVQKVQERFLAAAHCREGRHLNCESWPVRMAWQMPWVFHWNTMLSGYNPRICFMGRELIYEQSQMRPASAVRKSKPHKFKMSSQ